MKVNKKIIEMPKYHETYISILKILSQGEKMHQREMRNKVIKEFYSYLPEEILSQKNKSDGDNKFSNRIAWAKSDLKIGKFIFYPERGFVQITKKGKDVLDKGQDLTLQDIKNDKDYCAYYEHKKDFQEDNNLNEGISDLSPQDMVEKGFTLIENELKSELLEKLKDSNPFYFEKIILKLFQKMGYGDFQETKKSGDGGIDGVINQDALGIERIYTQAKRYTKSNVGELDIRNFIGAMSGDVAKGIFVTTSDFDNRALEKVRDARNHKIILINGVQLVELMIKYDLGVQNKNIYKVKEIDEDFFIED